jgi:hypothetical protein
MGRSSGGGVKIFESKEALDKYLEQDKKANEAAYSSYPGDKSDSGRGYAEDDSDGGGFNYYKVVWQSDTVFKTEEEAERELEKVASSKDPGDDSKVIIVGRFFGVKPDAAATLKVETEALVKTVRKLGTAPAGNLNIVKRESGLPVALPCFAECSQCRSVLNMDIVSKKRNYDHGICLVCQSESNNNRNITGVPVEEWQQVTGYSDAPGRELSRKRTLYTSDYEKGLEEASSSIRAKIDAFKKRKADLIDNAIETEPKWIIAWSTTSAHF